MRRSSRGHAGISGAACAPGRHGGAESVHSKGLGRKHSDLPALSRDHQDCAERNRQKGKGFVSSYSHGDNRSMFRAGAGNDSVKVERQTEAGYDEVVCPMPAVVTVTAGVVEPRYPSFKGIMAAKSKPVDNLTVADLGIDASQVGAAARARRSPRSPRPRPARRGDRGGRRRWRAARRRLPRTAEGGLKCRSTRCGCWPRWATPARRRSPSNC